jgi:hypothetical protein
VSGATAQVERFSFAPLGLVCWQSPPRLTPLRTSGGVYSCATSGLTCGVCLGKAAYPVAVPTSKFSTTTSITSSKASPDGGEGTGR